MNPNPESSDLHLGLDTSISQPGANLLPLPFEETLRGRQELIPSSCTLHYEKSPLKLVRSLDQYLYDENGEEYLDCINSVAHVGHCNQTVVNAAKSAMSQLGYISVELTDMASRYIEALKTVFPTELDTFLFVESGSEANELAVQLARAYTNSYDVVAVEGSYYGSLSVTAEISPKLSFTATSETPLTLPEWLHVVPCPDLYRGKYTESDCNASEKYRLESRKIIDDAVRGGKKLACFICEPVMTGAGVVIPPQGWLASVYNDMHSVGGLVIADETGCGLGRIGVEWWAYQWHNQIVPDIVTVGKPIGNGFPMAIVATRSSIAARLGYADLNTYYCGAVAAAVGEAVLNSIRSENLMKNARMVGSFLSEGLKSLAANHRNIGNVRGVGLLIGMEIVINREGRQPATEITEKICYKLKENHIIIGVAGPHKNVLFFSPPMCFDVTNAHKVIKELDKILTEVEEEQKLIERNFYLREGIFPGQNRSLSLGVFDPPSRSNWWEGIDEDAVIRDYLAPD